MMESSEKKKKKKRKISDYRGFKRQNLVWEDIYYSTVLALQFPNSAT